MSEEKFIPMFPLSILPLPGELVPLHIFEPRYKQLLHDAETNDILFGIYCSNTINEAQIGSLMQLESIVKTHPGGEADIIVKCRDLFSMSRLLRTYKNKQYPGGEVMLWEVDSAKIPGAELYDKFLQYMRARNIQEHTAPFSIYQIATELTLEISERYKFLTLPQDRQESFLVSQIRYKHELLKQEEKSKDVFHLN
jgi:Lon protease-like protein